MDEKNVTATISYSHIPVSIATACVAAILRDSDPSQPNPIKSIHCAKTRIYAIVVAVIK